MKRIISYILVGIVTLLLAGKCFGQSPALLSFGSSGIGLRYVPIPTANVLDSAVLTYSGDGSITNTTGGDTQTKLLSGNWTRVRANTITGTSGDYRRIVNAGDIEIGSVAGSASFDIATSNSNYFELLGKSPTQPLYFIDDGDGPLAAIQINAWATGLDANFVNVVNTGGGYAYFANSDGTLSGGDATTPPVSTNKYGDINLSFIRSWSPVDPTNGREHFYIGRTTTNSGAIYESLNGEHLFGINSDWDAIQVAWCRDCNVRNSTFINSGLDNSEAQDASIQFANSSGKIENNIFYNAPQAARITGYDIVIRNNYFHWTDNELEDGIQILDYDLNYADGARITPQPSGYDILIENNDFVATTWTGALVQVFDNVATITVRNNRIQGPTSLFADQRSGSVTGQLIDGGGNSFVSGGTIPEPTFVNLDSTKFTTHGLLTEPYHHAKGRGYRQYLPLYTIATTEAIDTVDNVLNGTSFADLVADFLPRYAVVNVDQDTTQFTLLIYWQRESYDSSASGYYTLTGIPIDLPSNVSNPDNVEFEVVVFVQEDEIFRKILLNLTGTSGGYVGTGNWNHIRQSFSTGAQSITGDNSGDALASLRDTTGTLTGYGVSITSQFEGNTLGQNPSGAGVYPDNAIIGNWSNPGSSGTSRVFTLTGLNNSIAYDISILGSAADYLSGSSHLVTVQVSGSSGGGTLSNQEIEANISNKMVFNDVVPSSGVITITVTKTATGQAYINVLEMSWTE